MAEMAAFDWSDPFFLDDQLTEEERMIRDAAHGFAQDELQPRVIKAFRDEIDAPELFPLMGQAGLLGATIAPEYGGAGASYRACRFGLSLDGFGAVEPRDAPNQCLWFGRTASQISAGLGKRQADRLLRPDRTRCGQRSRRNAHPRQEG